ncbi:MAG: ribosomal-protein-alanine acetyltransferase [Zetaproteobacteria bacterium CG06_land_8_20_14_3_00_59_53]|nr:MAG: ribosomal-protein-alanine acetyltransferase [Zetaproteobacteria bacterium CG2_30_59_37]PIO90632.1 MAG: ribosomal-protein-alanine acetyltransferase [Zetaproteobacteria bacterium CG23_combo_of_CG06-09_8_20_14_all_59_86]PIQ66104.1 MAG: ribosomal-protein-alanine acetyltransferase [Zetaproteobacteria bacterium CG11_big_fil_rev_8_21_14_0_20_59_439]PIU71579.1 MAG: ribosomal-protein-alanine acetyltransferase [Zetaproteobacteria bacterium CG06_land_8_20_14_3_00_59_53]PIU97840.1 MAG: ribosomal-pr
MIRAARLDDVPALSRLERSCFDTDRLSERSFRHLLTRGNAALLVFELDGGLAGYSLTLFHQNTPMARLYSLAVSPDCRGKGIAGLLMAASEKDALAHGVVSMRLEVHMNNTGAIALYRKRGYREFALVEDYYEDHAAAVRMEKPLAPNLAPNKSHVPYYAQTLEFTCGPASLMMALKALAPKTRLDRRLELRIWREATSIFMTSGHGGCSPYGLALSAFHRGLKAELFVRYDIDMFVKSVRNPEKREVIRIVQEDFLHEIRKVKLPLRQRHLPLPEMEQRFREGEIPMVLISAYRLTGDKSPHWVPVCGFDERFVYIHEPFVDVEERKTETTCIGIPLARAEFERMRYYGSTRQYATLMLSKGE